MRARRPLRERAVGADAVRLTEFDGKGGELRDWWLDLLTSEGGTPRRGGVRRIAYAVAYHANNKTLLVFPSIEKLARRQAMGENTVRHAFKWLVANGWLILVEKGGGRSRTNRYVLSVPPWADEAG